MLSFLFIVSMASYSFAYQVRPVSNGGTIEGTVLFTGSHVPKDRMIHPTTNQNYCREMMPMLTYLIKSGKVQNVVVFIKNINSGAPVPRTPAKVDNYKCAFVPHVGIGFKGDSLTFKNSDPLFHNIHTYLNSSTYYNVGLPSKGMQVTKQLTEPGLIELTCDAHPWMDGWLYVFDNPYAAVTNAKGQFVIRNVPPGVYTIEAWHEKLGRVDLENIKVTGGATTSVKFTYKKAKGR